MKKIVITTLVLICMVFMAVSPALAQNTGEAPASAQATGSGDSTDTPPADTEGVLSIDNANTYAGMDRPYSGGYMPSASGGVANVVLPLVQQQDIRGSQINVSLDLGDTTASPFQFGNYDQTVGLGKHATAAGEQEAYLISVNLPLAGNRKMGNYPVIFNASGHLADGTPFTQAFTVFVIIRDGIDPEATPTPEPTPEIDTPSEEKPSPQPKIMLSAYSINPSPAKAGEPFKVTATLKNTNESQAINNVMITLSGETADIMPAGDDTGNFYFNKIGSGESVTVEMNMTTSPGVKPEPQKIKIAIEYEGNKASSTAYTADEEITVPISQPIRLDYDEPQIPASVNAGDTISVSVNVMNLGVGTVHNARLTLEAPGLIPEKTAFMGNIESGGAKKGDMYVFVGSLDMTEGGGDGEKYGFTSGTVTLAYEDEYGEEFTEEFPFETTINPPVILNEEQPAEEEEPKNQGQWWVSIIIAGAIIAAIFALRAFIKRKERGSEYEGE